MNTEEIERLIRRHVRDFDGVFSVDLLPSKPRLLVCNTDPSHRPGEHWVTIYVDEKDVKENISIRLQDLHLRPLYAIWINTACIGILMTDSNRVLSVDSVESIVCFIVFLEVKSRIVRSFTSDTGFNDVLVHGFICRQ